MQRLIHAFMNSYRAANHLLRHEKAVQQECILLLLAIPLAIWLGQSAAEIFLLIGVVIFIVIVEVLNTAIEAVCNAVTREYRDEIKIAKDAGSLAVLLSILMALCVWLWAVVKLFL